ncbi:hypothetical protein CU098_013613 [Rhizopus stolonifer]|uniref:Alpha/beta hydrolase fold-3 domain-containing protein n=1 Tax=Rhizopus stolonifer TaxID=4846 RepID=A0A367KVE4_RHIST|nr:hypothetical protein CU098_013613 [Rhizopus stolonifer]
MTKPFPFPPNLAAIVKSTLNLKTEEEACLPHNARAFFDEMSGMTFERPDKDAKKQYKDVEKQDMVINSNGYKVKISILRPMGSKDQILPVGGGWVIGSYNTHISLTSMLVNMIPACLVFVEYSLSPEVKFPVAIEECYAALCWVQENAESIHVDPHRLAVLGDSAGANISASLTIFAKQKGNNGISFQVLGYPVLDTDFETESYQQNHDDMILPRSSVKYFFDAYLNNLDEYKSPLATPLNSPLELLQGLPPALILTAELDVLRTEGEMYAKKLKEAGVDAVCVRYLGNHHGFLSPATFDSSGLAALGQIASTLNRHWNEN